VALEIGIVSHPPETAERGRDCGIGWRTSPGSRTNAKQEQDSEIVEFPATCLCPKTRTDTARSRNHDRTVICLCPKISGVD
jgi:hypothetical protein